MIDYKTVLLSIDGDAHEPQIFGDLTSIIK